MTHGCAKWRNGAANLGTMQPIAANVTKVGGIFRSDV